MIFLSTWCPYIAPSLAWVYSRLQELFVESKITQFGIRTIKIWLLEVEGQEKENFSNLEYSMSEISQKDVVLIGVNACK